MQNAPINNWREYLPGMVDKYFEWDGMSHKVLKFEINEEVGFINITTHVRTIKLYFSSIPTALAQFVPSDKTDPAPLTSNEIAKIAKPNSLPATTGEGEPTHEEMFKSHAMDFYNELKGDVDACKNYLKENIIATKNAGSYVPQAKQINNAISQMIKLGAQKIEALRLLKDIISLNNKNNQNDSSGTGAGTAEGGESENPG